MVRIKGQKGHNDATSILFLSALHQPMDISAFADQGTKIKLFRGEQLNLTCENNDDYYLYYIESGALEVGYVRPDWGYTVLFVRGPENCVLASLVDSMQSDTTFGVYAVRNTVLVAFTYEQVKTFIQHNEQFLDEYLYNVHMTMAQMGHRIDDTRGLSSTQRMLLWLAKLCEGNTPDEHGVYSIPCNLTLDEFCGVLDIHYATLNKLFKALKDRGIIARTRTEIKIFDRAQIMELLAQENPLLY